MIFRANTVSTWDLGGYIIAKCDGTIGPDKWEGLSDRQVFHGSRAVGPTVFTYSGSIYSPNEETITGNHNQV